MPPCHTIPFLRAGAQADPPAATAMGVRHESPAECCDYCGSGNLHWRKCKLVCGDCRQINKSCADL